MSTPHHGVNDSIALERLREQLTGRAKRAYSEGRISNLDDGDLSYAIVADHKKGVVMLDFTKPVEWLAMPPDTARAMARLLDEQALALERRR